LLHLKLTSFVAEAAAALAGAAAAAALAEAAAALAEAAAAQVEAAAAQAEAAGVNCFAPAGFALLAHPSPQPQTELWREAALLAELLIYLLAFFATNWKSI
jgi:hypothetical protein